MLILKRREKMIGQKSYIATKANTDAKWHVIDASGKVLGRVAVEAARVLRGKHKPEFTPNAKCGDYVIIINCAKAILTGNKLEQKEWIRHTGWIGGLKRVQYKHLMATRPELAMKMAVEGMLPHTSLGREQLTMLRVYAGEKHEHEAQVNAGTGRPKSKTPEKKKSPSTKAAPKAEEVEVIEEVAPAPVAEEAPQVVEEAAIEAPDTAEPPVEVKEEVAEKTDEEAGE